MKLIVEQVWLLECFHWPATLYTLGAGPFGRVWLHYRAARTTTHRALLSHIGSTDPCRTVSSINPATIAKVTRQTTVVMYPFTQKIIDIKTTTSTTKNSSADWKEDQGNDDSVTFQVSCGVALWAWEWIWKVLGVHYRGNVTLTWPKNRKGRRKVRPRHIQDWKPSNVELRLY